MAEEDDGFLASRETGDCFIAGETLATGTGLRRGEACGDAEQETGLRGKAEGREAIGDKGDPEGGFPVAPLEAP